MGNFHPSQQAAARAMDGARHRAFDRQELAILRSINTMRRNVSEELSVDTMAEWAFFSKYHYTRLFQRITHLSPGRFLSEYRVMLAEQLLTRSDLSFTDITYQVGYASVGTFSSRFKKVLGISPSAYRRQHRSPGTEQAEPTRLRPAARMVLAALAEADSVAGCCAVPHGDWAETTWERVG